ncbi:hypothetical protein EIQ30_10045 [Xanthomonas campestris]
MKPTQTSQLAWSLRARHRGTFGGMDAAKEPTGTYLRRVPRWRARKVPACATRACGLTAQRR